MRSFFAKKFWVILLSVLAVGALMGLAIGLKNISFRKAQAFGKNETQVAQSAPVDLINAVMAIPLKTHVRFLILIVMLFVLIGMLMSRAMREPLLRMLLPVVGN